MKICLLMSPRPEETTKAAFMTTGTKIISLAFRGPANRKIKINWIFLSQLTSRGLKQQKKPEKPFKNKRMTQMSRPSKAPSQPKTQIFRVPASTRDQTVFS